MYHDVSYCTVYAKPLWVCGVVPVPLLGLIPALLDIIVLIALIVALITISGIIKDFLAENLVQILVDMPGFDYTLQDGNETGGVLFDVYKRQRDMVLYPLIVIGAISWLVTGRFGGRISAAIRAESIKPIQTGIHPIMRPNTEFVQRDESTPYFGVSIGSDAKTGLGWFGSWLSGLPARCLLCVILIFVMPPLWDAAIDASAWGASTILNPTYSGDPQWPCPAAWYVDGRLDTTNPHLQNHHESSRWLLMQDDTGRLDAMCRPELRVRYMLEQWGGQTRAIPPPLDTAGTIWDMAASMGKNATDWIMRGIGEFFINIILGVIKAQAVIMSGTVMIVSNTIVDIGVATMITFMPIYLLLMLVPWSHIGGGQVLSTITKYGPAALASAILYPIEIAVLFAVSSDMMVHLLLSDYGNDLLVVWLFGTSVMSMAVAMPVVSLGAFAQVVETVTGKFTAIIQTAQGGLGAASCILGMRGAAAATKKP